MHTHLLGFSHKRIGHQQNAGVDWIVILFHQMQYCENSTLRRAIDMGLSENMERVWRYFRGITEGLLYIHEQVSWGVGYCLHWLIDCWPFVSFLKIKEMSFIHSNLDQ